MADHVELTAELDTQVVEAPVAPVDFVGKKENEKLSESS